MCSAGTFRMYIANQNVTQAFTKREGHDLANIKIGSHYLFLECSMKWAAVHKGPVPDASSNVPLSLFLCTYVCHIVPCNMANLLRYLGMQCSKLKVHRGDCSLSDRRSFVRDEVIANGVSPTSDIRRSWKITIYMTSHALLQCTKENSGQKATQFCD